MLGLYGCAMQPNPFSADEEGKRVNEDLLAMFEHQDPLPTETTLTQAMARALTYNLEHKEKILDLALAQDLSGLTTQQLLPRLASSAGYSTQDRITDPGTDIYKKTASLSISWNVLDFGVSYIQAKQQTDRVLIAYQQRRRAAQTLLQEVRSTFWRTLAAQRLQPILEPLLAKTKMALLGAQEAETQRLQPPMKILESQKTLLKNLEQLTNLWQELAGTSVDLAKLMNLPPGGTLTLIPPEEKLPFDLARLPSIDKLEQFALLHRPELQIKDYEVRIKSLETRKAILRLLPGLEFNETGKADANSSYTNHLWAESGISLAWNLINLFTAPKNFTVLEDQEKFQKMQRLSLSMSILAQVRIAWLRLQESRNLFEIADLLAGIHERLLKHASAGRQAASVDELELVRREQEEVIQRVRRDLALGDLQNAFGNFLVTLGLDPIPENGWELPPIELDQAIQKHEALLVQGEIPGLPLLEPKAPPEPSLSKISNSDEDPNVAKTEWNILIDNTSKPTHSSKDDNVAKTKWVIEIGSSSIPPMRKELDENKSLRSSGASEHVAYVIPIGYFMNTENAEQMQKKIESPNMPAFIQEIPVEGRKQWFVFAGPFANQTTAQNRVRKLENELGIKSKVIGVSFPIDE
ncbi:MAG: TolC family protein [Magnetococcus sp. DMHC-6]